jgi:DNA-binding transcriptional regulator YiaG
MQTFKKALSTYRTDIAALKRRTHALEQQVSRLTRASAKRPPAEAPDASATKTRFSAKSLASQRRRLGLSAAACGLLVGTTGQSVYLWEAGKVRPRPQHLPAIAALRSMGKKEAAAQLEALAK